ncbi:MAG: type IV pilus modification PilV family protein [Candidatus Rifleibacteriota bacterium]
MLVARRGVTLLEIITALLILAFAFLPLIGILGDSSSNSDVANSVSFAQTAARNILDTLLDEVPFYAIRKADGAVSDLDGANAEENVGEVFTLTDPAFDKTSFLAQLGNTSGADDYARGTLTDERNLDYKTKLFVFPITVSNPVDYANEMAFSCLPRPIYENQVDGSGQNNWYTYDSAYMNPDPSIRSPYEDADGSKVVQPPTILGGAYELGAEQGATGAGNNYCVMKKILLKITWTNRDGHDRSIDLFTMKANLQ